MGQVEGKVAIVTGAARGTGEATARALVAQGARVVIADVLDDLGAALADDLGSAASYHRLDVTSQDDWSRVVTETSELHGPPTILVNNAGVLVFRSLEETSLEDFQRVLGVNLIGAFLGMKAVVDAMRQAGGGSIVNVSSIDGLMGGNGRTAYCSSKFGLRGLAKSAALELGAHGIRVNTVCPGGGSAEMIAPWIPPGFDGEALRQSLALKRNVTLAEVAAAVVFLASDAASYVTGADLAVDGGATAGRILHGLPGDLTS